MSLGNRHDRRQTLQRAQSPMRQRRRSIALLETTLKVLSFLSAIASIFGVSVLGIMRSYSGEFVITDLWELAAILATGLLISVLLFLVVFLIARRPSSAMPMTGPAPAEGMPNTTQSSALGIKLAGRSEVTGKEKSLIQEATHTILFFAGDFSHVREISSLLQTAHASGVIVRVLGINSTVQEVIANFVTATECHCDVRLYEPPTSYRVKAIIVDPYAPTAEGAVVFVKKTHKDNSSQWPSVGTPGNDQTHEYVGAFYKDPMLVSAIAQMFEGLWKDAAPFPQAPVSSFPIPHDDDS